MSLLQFIVIVAAVVFILFAIDLYKRQKATILHFLIFFGGGAVLLLFAINNALLNKFGAFFGLARGADVIVYISIIVLLYLFIDLYNRRTRDVYQLTKLVSQSAIDDAIHNYGEHILDYKSTTTEDEFIFFIRAYNEEQTIGAVIDDIIKAGYRKLLIINDGSQDQTGKIIEGKILEHQEAMILHVKHTINRGDRGAGAATKTGYIFLQQHSDILNINRIVGFDADRQMDIKDMQTFRTYIEDKPADIYLGSRFTQGGEARNIPVFRKIILRIARVVTRVFYGSKMSDPHNGYRVISVKTVQKIRILSDGMHYANELNEQFQRYKCSYVEVPVHINYTDYSLSKGQKNTNSIRLALEMIYKKLFFR